MKIYLQILKVNTDKTIMKINDIIANELNIYLQSENFNNDLNLFNKYISSLQDRNNDYIYQSREKKLTSENYFILCN